MIIGLYRAIQAGRDPRRLPAQSSAQSRISYGISPWCSRLYPVGFFKFPGVEPSHSRTGCSEMLWLSCCLFVCLFLSFKSSLNICFSLCLSSTTPVRFGKIFLKGQKERTWRQLCCMSVGTQTCPCTPSVFYATDDKHKKFIPLLWAKRSPKLWQMLSPAQRNL